MRKTTVATGLLAVAMASGLAWAARPVAEPEKAAPVALTGEVVDCIAT